MLWQYLVKAPTYYTSQGQPLHRVLAFIHTCRGCPRRLFVSIQSSLFSSPVVSIQSSLFSSPVCLRRRGDIPSFAADILRRHLGLFSCEPRHSHRKAFLMPTSIRYRQSSSLALVSALAAIKALAANKAALGARTGRVSATEKALAEA